MPGYYFAADPFSPPFSAPPKPRPTWFYFAVIAGSVGACVLLTWLGTLALKLYNRRHPSYGHDIEAPPPRTVSNVAQTTEMAQVSPRPATTEHMAERERRERAQTGGEGQAGRGGGGADAIKKAAEADPAFEDVDLRDPAGAGRQGS
ncbi:MAG: hypothetical protein LQ346_005187, partial [Caloplaca aetnensis]